MPPSSRATFGLDLPATKKRVTALVRAALAAPGPLRVAAAYVTGDVPMLLGLPKERLRDLVLVCDPYSGNCNPWELARLASLHVDVRCVRRLHAKVYIGPTTVVVGSANVSGLALGRATGGTVEAVVAVSARADVATARDWFDALHARAVPWSALCETPGQLAVIEAAYRARGHDDAPGGEPGPPPADLPSLVEAMRRPNLVRGAGIVYSVSYESRTMPSDAAVARQARGRGIEVPDDSELTILETPSEKDVEAAEALVATVPWPLMMTLWVALDRAEQIARFRSVADTVSRPLAVFPVGDDLYELTKPEPAPMLPFDFSARSRAEATRALNAGLTRHPELAGALNASALLPADVIARLLE